jgi:MATE family multidrug resistance protein
MNPIRPLLARAVPIVSARLVQNAGLFLGSLMVAQLGEDELAASAIATSLSLAIFTFATSSLGLLAPMLSSLHAQDDERLRVLRRGFLAATLLGAGCSLVMLMVCVTMVWWEITPILRTMLWEYFLVLVPGYFPMLWTNVLQQYLLGAGRQTAVFWYAIFRVMGGAVVSFLCIFGLPGLFPGMGFDGLGLGVTLASCISCLGLGLFVMNQSDLRIPKWWSMFGYEPGAGAMLKKAIPIGIQSSMELAAFAVAVQILVPLGEDVLGAHQIVFQFVMLGLMVPYGLCDAVALAVGEVRKGEGLSAQHAIVMAGRQLAFAATGVLGLLYLFCPQILVGAFLATHETHSPEIMAIAVPYFRLITLYQILDGSRLITIGALRGQLRTREALSTSVLTFWVVALPLAALAILWGRMGPLALPMALNLGMLAGTASIQRVYHRTASEQTNP